DDARLRSPMSWTADPDGGGFTRGKPFRPLSENVSTHNVAAERGDPKSIYAFYKTMLRLRNSLPSIALGSYEAPHVDGQAMSYQRKLGAERTVVAINYGTSNAAIELAGLPADARVAAIYPNEGKKLMVADPAGVARVVLAPQSVRVWKVLP